MNSTFHTDDLAKVLKDLDTSAEGLTTTQATAKLNGCGLNELPGAKADKRKRKYHKGQNELAERFDEANNTCQVLRDGSKTLISAKQLVPGDIVFVSAGNRVFADLRIIESVGLTVDNSTLTGECEEQKRGVENSEERLVEAKNVLFCGSVVAKGSGKCVVCTTGGETVLGSIACLLHEPTSASMPKAKVALDHLTSKSIIVKSYNELLSLYLSDVLVFDKTGVLTTGEVGVHAVVNGLAEPQDKPAGCSKELLRALVLLSDGSTAMERVVESWVTKVCSGENGVTALRTAYPRLHLVPFNGARKFQASTHQDQGKDTGLLVAKGAPERILRLCDRVMTEEGKEVELSSQHRQTLEDHLAVLTKRGMRVIGVAQREVDSAQLKDLDSPPLEGLTFVGMVAFRDELRVEVGVAIKKAREQLKMTVVVATGDHPLTAQSVMAEALPEYADNIHVVTGQDIASDSGALGSVRDIALAKDKIVLLARMTPVQKLAFVRLLDEAGQSVLVVGDGPNDAPAMKASRCGVAMGIRGSDVVKDSSGVILVNDNIPDFVDALEFVKNRPESDFKLGGCCSVS